MAASKALPAFAVGDVVQWTSQAGGSTVEKKGDVVAVVPAMANLFGVYLRMPNRDFYISQNLRGCGNPRDHESYIVAVKRQTKNPRLSPKSVLYWPVVSLLKKAV